MSHPGDIALVAMSNNYRVLACLDPHVGMSVKLICVACTTSWSTLAVSFFVAQTKISHPDVRKCARRRAPRQSSNSEKVLRGARCESSELKLLLEDRWTLNATSSIVISRHQNLTSLLAIINSSTEATGVSEIFLQSDTPTSTYVFEVPVVMIAINQFQCV